MKRHKVQKNNGFSEYGGYMSAKISKLEEQFSTMQKEMKKSDLFQGISIFVNGKTNPSADDLKRIMLENGGIFHHYQRTHTQFIIANNIADVKIRSNIKKNIIKPGWIIDCLRENRILDYSNYLLHSNRGIHQSHLVSMKINPGKSQEKSFKLNLNKLNQKIQQNLDQLEIKTGAADDDNFLEDFLKKSRLHCISTLANDLKNYIIDLRKKCDEEFPERRMLKSKFSCSNNFQSYKNVIIHIDMDCFFVAVGIRNKPHLKGFPIAVTHYKINNDQEDFVSFSEIACCNYEARAKGIKNGMLVGQALKLCPELLTIPYEFEEYRRISYKLYQTVAKYTLNIEAVSCDELYADLTDLLNDCKINRLMEFISMLRKEIYEQTLCSCSIGIGSNRLQSRMATKEAKPDGQFELLSVNIEEYMKNKNIIDLPGIGSSTEKILKRLELQTCGQVQKYCLHQLENYFGKKFGRKLFMMAKGLDEKKLNYEQIRKSVSVDINYGIRFNDNDEVIRFLKKVCEELCIRLNKINKKGKYLTLKIMVRAPNESFESTKFMGHGVVKKTCKSTILPFLTNDPFIIFQNINHLFFSLNIPPYELRGIGIQISKLFGNEKNNEKQKNIRYLIEEMSKKKPKYTDQIKQKPKVETKELTTQKRQSNNIKKHISSNILSATNFFCYKKSTSFDKESIDFEISKKCSNNIVEEIAKDNKISGSRFEKNLCLKKKDLKNEMNVCLEVEQIEKNIFVNENWKLMIIELLVSNNVQEIDNIEDLLSNNLKQLVWKNNLKIPFLVMRFLYRHVNTNNERKWKELYDNINSKLQSEMKKKNQDKKLKTPSNFFLY